MDNTKTFDERFGEYAFRRIEDISKAMYQNEEYMELHEKYSEVANKVSNLIPRELFSDFETANGLIDGFAAEQTYIKGLADGIKLFKLLNDGGSNNGKR